MQCWYRTAFFVFAALACAGAPSALEKDPAGWVDLMPSDAKLSGWTRLPLPPNQKLSDESQWKVTDGVLVCEGDKGHEALRTEREYTDFILHVEYRYTKVDGDPRYNSGVFARILDQNNWLQAQAGAGQGGWLFGTALINGEKARTNLRDQLKSERVKPAGEWNVLEVTTRGPQVSLWVNGEVTSVLEGWPALKGPVGLEAEGFRIEFRNVRIKELK